MPTSALFIAKTPAATGEAPAAAMRPLRREGIAPQGLAFAIFGLTLIGLLLRLAAARGDLWLDEIWSLENLQKIHSAAAIFYRLSDANNHFLNSLWLWIVGPDAPPIVLRGEAILCGTLTVPVAARLCGRAGPIAALAGAAVAAVSLLFVQYGSEARGYAGLLLMIFVAAETLEIYLDARAAADRPKQAKARLAFGLAVGLGALFHLTMLVAAASLIAATVLRLAVRGLDWRTLFAATIDLASPAALGAAPALAALIAGAITTHAFYVGTLIPFSLTHLSEGLGVLIDATTGLPFAAPASLPLALMFSGLAVAARVLPREKLTLPATLLLLPPLLAAAAQTPNVHIARFHLVGALGLTLLAAEILQKLVADKRPLLALVLGLGMLAGNTVHITNLIAKGRGQYRPLVAAMATQGGTYASELPAEVIRTVRFYDKAHRLTAVPNPDWCRAPPDWFIVWDDGMPAEHDFGPRPCRSPYRLTQRETSAALSGLRLGLYRRR